MFDVSVNLLSGPGRPQYPPVVLGNIRWWSSVICIARNDDTKRLDGTHVAYVVIASCGVERGVGRSLYAPAAENVYIVQLRCCTATN